MSSESKYSSLFSNKQRDSNLKDKSVHGGMITVSEHFLNLILRLGSTAVLARILTPTDFGLVAMVATLLGFLQMFKDAGLSMATIQKKEITHHQVSNLFWLNFILSLSLGVFFCSLAPIVASIYGEPKLTKITVFLSMTFLFSGLTVQHQALLRRQMKFGRTATANILSQFLSILIAIYAAHKGFGYWSLVLMTVSSSLINMILIWLFCHWIPTLPKRNSGVFQMVKFGVNLTLTNFLVYIRRNLHDLLIGIFFGAQPLALYTKAYSLLLLPIRQINGPLSSVAIPALSSLQGDNENFRIYYSKFIEIMTFFGIPIIIFSFLAADEMILILLGDQWLGAVPILRALMPAALMGTINIAGGVIYISLGMTDKQLRANAVASLVFIGAIATGLLWGVIGVAIAFSLAFCICTPGLIAYAYKYSPIDFNLLFKSLWKQCLSSLVAYIIVIIIEYMIIEKVLNNIFIEVLLLFIFYSTSYLITYMLIPGGRDFLAELSKLILKKQNFDLSTIKDD